MTSKYQEEIEDAYNDIVEAGVEVKLIQEEKKSRGDGSGEVDITITEQIGYGVFELSELVTSGEGFINGTLIESSDKYMMLASKGIEPEPKDADKLEVLESKYKIKNVNPFEPDGFPIYYILHIGKG